MRGVFWLAGRWTNTETANVALATIASKLVHEEGTHTADVIKQTLIVVLDPRDTDLETFQQCIENQFGLSSYSRAVLAPQLGIPYTVYQAPDGRQLRIEGTRLAFEGAGWMNEAGHAAECLRDVLRITGIEATASGVNPVLLMGLRSQAVLDGICHAGAVLNAMMGDQVAISKLTATASVASGRLTCEMQALSGADLRLHMTVNWHEDHESTDECIARIRKYSELVEQLRLRFSSATDGGDQT